MKTGTILCVFFVVGCNPQVGAPGAKVADSEPSDAAAERFAGNATYYGLAAKERGYHLYITPDGEIVAGTVVSSDGYAGVAGGAQPVYGGGEGGDYLFVRFNEELSQIQNATYFGASTREIRRTLLHGRDDGSPIVANWSRGGWPVTQGASQTTHAGNDDFAIARISPDLTSTIGATYWGGSADEQVGGACTSPTNGDIYVVGEHLLGADPVFNVPGHDQVKNGGTDAIALRFNADLTELLGATLKGHGSIDRSGRGGEPGEETFGGCVVAKNGNTIYLFGRGRGVFIGTHGTEGAYRQNPAYPDDPYICRYTVDLTKPLVCTHLGVVGAAHLSGYWKPDDVLVHPNGDLYIVQTVSEETQWIAATPGAFQETRGGGKDIAITRFSRDLSTVVASTFIGDVGNDVAHEATIRADGSIIIGGNTDGPFATSSNALYPNPSGTETEGILFAIDEDLTTVTESTYFGPGSLDIYRVVIHENGYLYLSGVAVDGLPETENGAQPIYGGGETDMYVARVSPFLDDVPVL